MRSTTAVVRGIAALALLGAFPEPLLALPTMIRLGYSECSACHISPQGGGLLNPYGRGIDQAQSLRGGEYTPATGRFLRTLTLGGRITQDLRTVLQEQASFAAPDPVQTHFRPRVMYRNATAIGRGFRISATATADSSSAYVNTALVHYRAGETIEFAAGKDQLPSGLNLPDTGLWIKSRNRFGTDDSPEQIKMWWSGARVHLSPFVYRMSGNQPAAGRHSGAGTLAEFVLGPQKAVLGLSLLDGGSPLGDRTMVGGYVRLGFGQWGIFAEHDLTSTRPVATAGTVAQQASYGQLFWAVREWLVASAGAERLRVAAPLEEKLIAAKLEIAARLASQMTLGVNARLQHNQVSGRSSLSMMLQASFKTVR